MAIFIYPALGMKYAFWENLVRKAIIVCLRWNRLLWLIQMCWLGWWSSNFIFRTENALFGQIWFKKSKLFQMKVVTHTNSNMLNLIVVIIWPALDLKYFLGKFNPKNQYCQFNPLSANPTKWSNTLKQFVGNLPTNCLSVFDQFVISALKGLRWNLVLTLIRIY